MKNGWRPWSSIGSGVIIFALVAFFLPTPHSHATQPKTLVPTNNISGEALRLNTLGVAYMNQGKSSDAQKSFEKALAADPNFRAGAVEPGIFAGATKLMRRGRRWRKRPASCRMIHTLGTTWGWRTRTRGNRKMPSRHFSTWKKSRRMSRMHFISAIPPLAIAEI